MDDEQLTQKLKDRYEQLSKRELIARIIHVARKMLPDRLDEFLAELEPHNVDREAVDAIFHGLRDPNPKMRALLAQLTALDCSTPAGLNALGQLQGDAYTLLGAQDRRAAASRDIASEA